MVVDVTNENQEYWEKILAESDLSKKEEPEIIAITAEEFNELANLEILPEEDLEHEDDPIINYRGITQDIDTLNADHSGLYETNEELRTKIDYNEPFFEGHRIIKPYASGPRANRKCPAWANSNAKIRALLLRSFPKLATNKKQRQGAGRWARIIQMYYRSQMTHGQICTELRSTLPTVASIIRAIDRAVKGKRANGRPRIGRKRAII